jgi:hypothetical protein
MKHGFIIMTHNGKKITGMASSAITTQETIQGAGFCMQSHG